MSILAGSGPTICTGKNQELKKFLFRMSLDTEIGKKFSQASAYVQDRVALACLVSVLPYCLKTLKGRLYHGTENVSI